MFFCQKWPFPAKAIICYLVNCKFRNYADIFPFLFIGISFSVVVIPHSYEKGTVSDAILFWFIFSILQFVISWTNCWESFLPCIDKLMNFRKAVLFSETFLAVFFYSKISLLKTSFLFQDKQFLSPENSNSTPLSS